METINVFCAECGNLLKAIADEDGSIFVELCEHCAWKYQMEALTSGIEVIGLALVIVLGIWTIYYLWTTK